MVKSEIDGTNVQKFDYKYQNLSKILFCGISNEYLIVSGKNYLLKFLSNNLTSPIEIRETGPVNDSVLCAEPNRCSMSICSHELRSQDKCRQKPTDVFVKSWTIAEQNLVVCYNVYLGYCETIDLYFNFSAPALGKGYSIVTHDLKSHSTILHFQNKVYVAIEINALLNYQFIEFSTISIRQLPNMTIIKSEFHIFHPFYGRLGSGLKTIFPLEFKGSFIIHDKRKDTIMPDLHYIFFLVNQPENKIDPKNGKFQMRLVRLCSKDDDFSSLIDIGLYCENDKPQTYYQIESWNLAYVANNLADWYRNKTRFRHIKDEPEANFNQILYINLKIIEITDNYKENLNSFVTCAFPIAEIMELFDIVKNKCFNGEGSVNERPYDINSNDIPCDKDDFSDKRRGYCEGKMKNKHIIGEHFGNNSVVGYKVIAKEGLRGTNLLVFQIYEQYTIAVIGGSDGVLYQYELFEDKYHHLSTSDKLFDNKFDMELNETNTTIFAVSNSKIVTIGLKNCHILTTCETCLTWSPFCGWCIMSGKCVGRSDCNVHFWIPYRRKSDNNMCPEIRNIPSHNILEYLDNVPFVSFQIIKTPGIIFLENSQFLRCQYLANNIEIISVNAQYFKHNYSISCNGLPKNKIPSFQESQNFIEFTLKVFVNQSYLVEGVYYIYNCAHSKRCSLCTDNKFNCTWCVLDNLCVPAFTKCKRNYKIHSNASFNCPKVEVLNKSLVFHANNPISVNLIVKRFDIYMDMKTNFICVESCENSTVRAIVLPDSGTIYCNFNKIKLSIHGVVKCSLTVLWRYVNSLSGLIESDNSIEFIIFDCAQLAQHCDDCVLLPQMYQCGFCSSSNTCIQRGKCNDDAGWINLQSQNCPSPIINEIIPENSTLYSETTILIKGRNLGFYDRNIKNSISLENARLHISCKFIDKFFINAKQFMCKIQNVTDRIDTPVTFHFVYRSKPYLAKKEFYFFTASVESIKPKYGPLFGGTIIHITGNYLNIGSKRQIYFKDARRNNHIACIILKNVENLIACRINEFGSNRLLIRKKRSLPERAILQISVDQNIIEFNHIYYAFMKNPIIRKISRNNILAGGGQILNIIGSNLYLIHKPCLALYCKRILSPCEECWINDSVVYCLTPKTIYINESINCDFLFGMENGTVSIYNSSIQVYPTPTFKKFNEKINLPSISFSFIKNKLAVDTMPIQLNLNDQISRNAFIESDINVSIGSIICSNATLTPNNIQCTIATKQINIYKKYSVNIKIGQNLLINLGYTQFEKGDIALDTISAIIIAMVIAVVIVTVIIVSVIIVKKVSRNQKLKNEKQNIFTEKVMKDANEILKQGITELNQIEIQDDIHKNWNAAPIHPYNVYILYNLFPNTHPRLCSEIKDLQESIFDTNCYNYNSNNPNSHPLIFNKQIQVIESTIEYSRKLSKLFEDDLFVLMFFMFLEDHQEVDSKKSDIISFLSLILMKDMLNYTKILKILIKNDYDKKKLNDEERSMFRQSDLLSKLLSNWFFILMYDHLQNINAGGDLLILYINILNVINNGPVNFESSKSQYTLNENSLLNRKIEFTKLILKVKHDIFDKDPELEIDVLDCDCITQVKLKIFEAIYKYTPYSDWLKLDDYDLVQDCKEESVECEQLIKQVVLKEQVGGSYKTLRDYGIKSKDILRIIQKTISISGSNTGSTCHSMHIESNSASLKTNRSRNLIKEVCNNNSISEIYKRSVNHKLVNKKKKKEKLVCCKNTKSLISKETSDFKPTCLIYTQVLKTKIEQQVKNIFDDIFDYESAPPCVLDLFTHFNNICKDDSVLFAVKSNSLILRFWIQLINNIDFLFDIPLVKHTPVLDCLKCVSRILMDICSENQNKDVWLTQLFTDVIKTYSPKVLSYYEGMKTSSNCNYNDYYADSRIDGINISLAIVILYQNYIKCVHDEFIESIQNSNYPKNKQTEWIYILNEVKNLYSPEPFLSEVNGNIKTTVC